MSTDGEHDQMSGRRVASLWLVQGVARADDARQETRSMCERDACGKATCGGVVVGAAGEKANKKGAL
jgi:hypothetical protein